MKPRFNVYKDKRGEWRFNLTASNGEIIAASEGYSSKRNALYGVELVRNLSKEADLYIEGEMKQKVETPTKPDNVEPEEEIKTFGAKVVGFFKFLFGRR